jgi:hypothetical protein
VRFAWGCRWPCSLVSCILPPHSRCHRLLEIFSLGLELGVLACAWRDRGGGEEGCLRHTVCRVAQACLRACLCLSSQLRLRPSCRRCLSCCACSCSFWVLEALLFAWVCALLSCQYGNLGC